MIGALIGLIFALIILGVIFWGCQQLLALVPLAEPFATIVRVLLVVVAVLVVLWVVITLLGIAGIHVKLPNLSDSGSFRGIATAALSVAPGLDLSGLLS